MYPVLSGTGCVTSSPGIVVTPRTVIDPEESKSTAFS
jgi:hypothetical protein